MDEVNRSYIWVWLRLTCGGLGVTHHTSTHDTNLPDSGSPRIAENQQISSRRACLMRPPPPRNFRTERNNLTAPADRPAHAVAFAITVAAGGAGSIHRQTGMRAARSFPSTQAVPDPRPPAIPAAWPAIQTRCFADRHPVWRCEAGADVLRADSARMLRSARGARGAPHNTSSRTSTHSRTYPASIAEIHSNGGAK